MTGRRLSSSLALLSLVSALLGGCATKEVVQADPVDPLEKLYAEARADMGGATWDKAIKSLEKIEARSTGTLMGQQAMLDLAYAYWKTGERAAALVTLDRFVRLNPSSPAMDYALYLKGLVNFNDSLGLFGGLAGQQISERDQQAYKDAYQAFVQLIQQHPQSKYTADAKVRMDFIVNALAEYEVHVARYYMKRGAYLAAANRAQAAIGAYEGAPALEEALAVMIEAYDKLGLKELRDDARRVLKANFPASLHLGKDAASSDAAAPAKQPWWKVWR